MCGNEDRSSSFRNLWREDAKLGQNVANAKNEMDNAERGLSGVMDKVSSTRCIETTGRDADHEGHQQWLAVRPSGRESIKAGWRVRPIIRPVRSI